MTPRIEGLNNSISRFGHCYGCGVCAVVCPLKAIQMRLNSDGFYSPEIDAVKCTQCGLCLSVCAFNHQEVCSNGYQHKSFASWSNDENTRINCTSGGVTYEIARLLLKDGYKVYGVRYNIDKQLAEHYISSTENGLKESIGSKYIQSDTFGAFSNLANEKSLVIGTPCQIDSIRRMIIRNKWEDNYLLVDFFCHSVPSLLMWHKYLEEIGIKNPETVQFRNKRNNWHDSTTICIKGDGKEWFSPLSKGDLFYSFFLGDRCPNECCVKDCKYKLGNSAADIRVGDMWGKKYQKNNLGVSAVIALTQNGLNVIEKLHGICSFESNDFNTVSELQMKHNVIPSPSWSVVRRLLRTKISLNTISRIAFIIEIPLRIHKKIRYCHQRFLRLWQATKRNDN